MGAYCRCPECGGFATHIITDIDGKTYYRCTYALTTFRKERTERGITLKLSPSMEPCDTIIDQSGKKFTGTIAFTSEGQMKFLSVTDGKERR